MIKLELQVDEVYTPVDLDDSTNISINISQGDLTNPTAVKIPFSFQASLPKTKVNNRIFAHIDIRSTSRLFNPLELMNFRLYVNESLFQAGYINLEKVDIEPDGFYYIRLYGGLGNFFNRMADIPLSYLNVECQHQINKDTLKELIEQDNGVYGYTMSYQGKYPQFDEGKKDDGGIINDATWTGSIGQRGNVDLDENRRAEPQYAGEYRSYYQKPTLRFKAVFEAIIKAAENEGFTINLDEDFFSEDNPYYEKLWLLCNNIEVGEVAGSYGFTVNEFGDTETLRENSEHRIQHNDATDLSGETIEAFRFVSTNANCPVVIAQNIPLNEGDNLVINFDVGMLATFYDNSSDDQRYRYKKDGLECVMELYNSETKALIYTGTIQNVGADTRVSGRRFNDNNVERKRPSFRNSSYFGEQNFFYDTDPNNIPNPENTINGNTTWRFQLDYSATSEIIVTCVFRVKGTTYWGVKSHHDRKYGVAFMVRDTSRISVRSNDSLDSEGRTGSLRDYPDLIGSDYNCLDLMLSYCKMFGLIFKVNNVRNEIDILLRDNFYAKDKVLDWSERIDLSKELTIEPLGFNFQRGVFKYNDLDTKYEKLYLENNDIPYGSFETDTGYRLEDNEYNYLDGIIFDNCVIASDYSQYYAGRSSIALRDNKELPHLQTESAERVDQNGFILLFRDEPQRLNRNARLSDDTQLMNDEGLICWNNSNEASLNTNLISGYYRTIKTEDDEVYSLNFGTPGTVYSESETIQNTNSGIYARYWRAYINDRIYRNCKVLTCYVHLLPSEVNADLLSHFIYINGSLWVIDDIVGFNATMEQPTKVVLVKVRDTDNYLKHDNLSDEFVISYDDEVIFDNQQGNYPSLIIVEDTVSTVTLNVKSSVIWSASSNVTISPNKSSEPDTDIEITFPDNQLNAFVRFMYAGNSVTVRFERKKLFTVTASTVNGGSALINGQPSPQIIQAGRNATFSASGGELIYWEINGIKYTSNIVNVIINSDTNAVATFATAGQIKVYCDDDNTTVSGVEKTGGFFLLTVGNSYTFSNSSPNFSGFLFSSERMYRTQGAKTIEATDNRLSVYYDRVLLNITAVNKSNAYLFEGQYITIGGKILSFEAESSQSDNEVIDVDVDSEIILSRAPYHYPTFSMNTFPSTGVFDLTITGNLVGWPGDVTEDVAQVGAVDLNRVAYSPIAFTVDSDLNIFTNSGTGNTTIRFPLIGYGGYAILHVGGFDYTIKFNQKYVVPIGWSGTGEVASYATVPASLTSVYSVFYHNNNQVILSPGLTKGPDNNMSYGTWSNITATFGANTGEQRQLVFTVTVNNKAYLLVITQLAANPTP